nr:hypothetical protein B0A51_16426 [Rachicladosporium sp. CCFEE 5018]
MHPTSTYALSASCQQITAESFDLQAGTADITVRSCIADPCLWPIIRDHKCNGVNLTPSGLYGDMATTVTKYILSKLHPDSEHPDSKHLGLNVADMHVEKTLIADNPQKPEGQWIEMTASCAGPEEPSPIHCTISQVQPGGTEMHKLAHCIVHLEPETSWHADWAPMNPLILTQIQSLESRSRAEATGNIRTVYKAKAYELFKSFVEYDGKYQAMTSVIYSTQPLEATAMLSITASAVLGDLAGPYHLDGSCHLSGFLCNAADNDSKKNAYISHGWDSARISSKFQPEGDEVLRNYVRMMPEGKDVLGGTVWVLQGDEIVGVWEGVRFKKISRRVLNVFLPPPKKRKT